MNSFKSQLSPQISYKIKKVLFSNCPYLVLAFVDVLFRAKNIGNKVPESVPKSSRREPKMTESDPEPFAPIYFCGFG